MVVTKIEAVNTKKSRIYIDEAYAFTLYKREVGSYQIAEGEPVTEEVYSEITDELLPKRGKMRMMYLLQSMDRTESQIRRKLYDDGYPESVIDEIVAYGKEYHYIDDERYVVHYLETKGSVKSQRQIQMDLLAKGVSSELIRDVLEEHGTVDEAAAIRRWIEKKHIDREQMSQEQIAKFFQFMARKGFRYEDVRREL